MSTQTIYLTRGTQIIVRSDRKGEYLNRLARDVKVDQTVKLQLMDSKSLKLFSVIEKVIMNNGDVLLSVRHLPPFRNEIEMLAYIDRARSFIRNRGCGTFNAGIKLERPEMGITHVQAVTKIETLRSNSVCACCGSNLHEGELVLRTALTPSNARQKFRVQSKNQDSLHRFFHFHNCMSMNQQYKVTIRNEKIEHVVDSRMRDLNEKAFEKAQDFQIPWVILSRCRKQFMFAYDTRSISSVIARMSALGTPAKYLCRVTRTSLNLEQPMSKDQFEFLLDQDIELSVHKESGRRFVTCAELIESRKPIYRYADTVQDIQQECLDLRASQETACYGFASLA